ncbi:MAG: WYL domain-containing protein [Tannerella sp.]|nr:WYL domain-containing protein [Tannerella sp.]
MTVKAFGKKCKYLQTLPLHHSQQEIETTKDYSVFQYYIAPTTDFRQELLSHGEEIEVLSPESFREEIRAIARRMNELY